MNAYQRRLEILDEVTRLNSLHPNPNARCASCEICDQIRELGIEYETISTRDRKERYQRKRDMEVKQILAKGEDATKSDIEFLIEVTKMSKRQVAEQLGVANHIILAVCRQWGIGEIRRTG